MRSDTLNFIYSNLSRNKEPRYTIEVAFDTSNTDLYYFTSHDDCAIPSTSPASSVIYGVVANISGTTQSINPQTANSTIGAISFELIDDGESVSAVINNKLLIDGNGLRHKRVRVYVGYEGLSWSDYTLVQTQIIEEISYSSKNASYKVKTNDTQRELREELFNIKTTYLTQSITATDTFIPVDDTSEFEVVAHGTSYSDAPSSEVLYIRIDDEIIRCTGPDTSSPTLGTGFAVDQRGALGTYAVPHEVDINLPIERRKKVEEVVYLEMPAVKLAYALITGNLYGQSGKTLPSHWHLGVSSAYISTAEFENIGNDIWDTSDDTKGVRVRFIGLEEEKGKSFIEKELYLLCGIFSPVRTDGQLGLRRLSSVLNGADTVFTLDSNTIVSHGDLKHAAKEVRNQYYIAWNWDWFDEKFTRYNILQDNNSISKHGDAPLEKLEFRGLFGNVHTTTSLAQRFNSLRDRFAGPPLHFSVTTLLVTNFLEVGDVVRVRLSGVKDFSNDSYTRLDRAFEVQRVRIDWVKGQVSLDLFGSSEPASLSDDGLVETTDAVLNDSFYNSEGTELSTVLTISGDTVTANGSLTGVDAFGGSPNGIYYYLGDLTIQSGVTVTISDNVQLRIRGTLDVQGKIDGRGNGRNGGAQVASPTGFDDINPGTSGYIGYADGNGGLDYAGPTSYRIDKYNRPDSARVSPQNHNVPYLNILNPSGTGLTGLPSDLRGSSGSSGCPSRNVAAWIKGGTGGNSGAGLMVISRGMTIQTNGLIDLSGGDGSSGDSATVYNSNVIWGGSGGAGGPGALVVLLDGSLAPSPTLVGSAGAARVLNQQGDTPFNGDDNGAGFSFFGGGEFWSIYFATAGSNWQNNDTLTFDPSVWSSSYTIFASDVAGVHSQQYYKDQILDNPPLIVPTTPNGYIYRAVALGTPTIGNIGSYAGFYTYTWDTGGTEPSWPTTITGSPNRVVDGDITWECTYDSYLSGTGGGTRVQRLPRAVTPTEDEVSVSDLPTLVAPSETTNLPQTLNENLSTTELGVTPPADDAYSYSNIYYKLQSDDAWTYIGPAQDEATITLAMDGTTYDYKVHSVSIYGDESSDFVSSTFTTSDAVGGVIIESGNFLSYAKTGYSDDSNIGFWLGVDDTASPVNAKFNLGSSSKSLKWDGSDLVVTGTINANGGDIAGWTVTSSAITSPNGKIILDSSSQWVKVTNGASPENYITLDSTGLKVVDGASGTLAYFPTDGSSVTLTGVITALEGGDIAGWTINASTIESPNSRIILDSSNQYIRVENAGGTNYIEIDGDGIYAYDSVLGNTVNIPTDGSAPTFSSGVIQEYEFQVYTSGVIKTADDPTATGGVLINNTGLYAYDGTVSPVVQTAYISSDGSAHSFTGSVTVTGGDWKTATNIISPGYSTFEDDNLPSLTYFNGTVQQSASHYYFGSHSLQLSASADDNSCYFGSSTTDYNIQITPYKKWLVSFYSETDNASNTWQAFIRTDNAGTHYYINGDWDSASTWERKYGIIDLTSDPSRNMIFRIDNNVSGSVMWVDGVMIEEALTDDATPSAFTMPTGGDKTKQSIETGLTITSGQITGGTDTILLDFANRYISINDETYGGSGIQLDYNSGTPRMYVGDGSNTYMEYSGGNLTVGSLKTSTSGQRIELNPSGSNELYFYGSNGSSPETIEKCASIGIISSGGFEYIVDIGSTTNTRLGLNVQSASTVWAARINHTGGAGYGLNLSSDGGYGLYYQGTANIGSYFNNTKNDSGAIGCYALSTYGIGLVANCNGSVGVAPLKIDPDNSSPEAPSHTASVGCLWVSASGILYIYTSGGWTKVGSQ